MSSTNNAAPDETIIDVENDDATIPNQNQSIAETEGRHQASTATENVENKMDFWHAVIHSILRCIHMGFEMYNKFDKYLLKNYYFIFSMILALIGFWKNEDLLIMPAIFVTACDTIYAIISIIFILISFESDGREFSFKELFYWQEMDDEDFDDIDDIEKLLSLKNYLEIKLYFFSVVWNLMTCLTLLNLIIGNFKKKRNQIINYRNTIHEQRHQLQRESMLSQFPPPPSYQDFADSVIVISPPQTGIPPPDYSILEEHQIEPPAASTMDETEILHKDFSATTTS